MGTGEHRNNFDALRLTAALAVMVSHAFALSGNAEPRPYAGITLGTYAVYVFFAVSGYLVTQSWQHDPNAFRFSARRALRIAPAYLVALVIVPAFLYVTGISFEGNPLPEVNGSLWTIPLEVQCYIAFLLLAALTKRFGPPAFAVAALVLGTETDLGRFAGFFAMGALTAQFPILRSGMGRFVLIAAGIALCMRFSPHYGIVLTLTALTIWIGTSSWPAVRAIGKRGDFSYGTYLYAYPAQQLCVYAWGAHEHIIVLFIAALTITGPLAWASWNFIEQPALRLKGRLTVPLQGKWRSWWRIGRARV